MRIIVDTNLWISFLISKKFTSFSAIIQSSNVELVLSDALIKEVLVTAARSKFHSLISPEDIKRLKVLFSSIGTHIPTVETVKICRDPNDDFLLSLAISAGVDYLLTGDKDLLVLNKVRRTRIITYSEWIKLYEQ
tara:strand:- start:54 stop:458 length:405 start_codon:yes stop_codon:yes gene_type:complete